MTVDVTVASNEVDGIDERLAEAVDKYESDEIAVKNKEIDAIPLADEDNEARLVRVMREVEVAFADTLPCIVDV